MPKAQETAKSQYPAVWSLGTGQAGAASLAPACILPASVPRTSSLCSTQLRQRREIRLYGQGEGPYHSLGAPQLTPPGAFFLGDDHRPKFHADLGYKMGKRLKKGDGWGGQEKPPILVVPI